MSEAEAALADLDAALAEIGETVRLQRLTGTQQIPFEVECHAVVRGYAPAEVAGSIAEGDSKIIISPSEIIASGWPGPGVVGATERDRRVPRRGDRIIIAGRARNIEAAAPFYVADVLVRIELQARG